MMDNLQLTSEVNELKLPSGRLEAQLVQHKDEISRQNAEIAKLNKLHTDEHGIMKQINAQLDKQRVENQDLNRRLQEAVEKAKRAMATAQPIDKKSGSGARSETNKKLDKWAMATPNLQPFDGNDHGGGLREWMKKMKASAGYRHPTGSNGTS